MTDLKLYDELAEWWPLLSAPEDYAEEAAAYTKFLQEASDGTMRTVLELGSGGGNNASHMKRHFAMTLVEPSAGMLAVSRRLNPECEHHLGDMRTFRIDRAEVDGPASRLHWTTMTLSPITAGKAGTRKTRI